MSGWGNKLNGLCVRLCGILHAADGVVTGGAWAATPVAADVVRRAVTLCREYALPHARAAFGLMGETEAVTKARRLLRWIGGRRPDPRAEFTRRDAFNVCRATFPKVEDLQVALDLLVAHSIVRAKGESEYAPRGPGRRPSAAYEVNPRMTFG